MKDMGTPNNASWIYVWLLEEYSLPPTVVVFANCSRPFFTFSNILPSLVFMSTYRDQGTRRQSVLPMPVLKVTQGESSQVLVLSMNLVLSCITNLSCIMFTLYESLWRNRISSSKRWNELFELLDFFFKFLLDNIWIFHGILLSQPSERVENSGKW